MIDILMKDALVEYPPLVDTIYLDGSNPFIYRMV